MHTANLVTIAQEDIPTRAVDNAGEPEKDRHLVRIFAALCSVPLSVLCIHVSSALHKYGTTKETAAACAPPRHDQRS